MIYNLKRDVALRLAWPRFSWTGVAREAHRLALTAVGALMCSLGYVIFQVPHQIAAGGVSGTSVLINHFTGWPVGQMILAMNLPLFILGFFYLGRWRFVGRSIIGVLIFSLGSDVLLDVLPGMMESYPLTNDLLLNALYGGIVGGIGGGIVYRAGSTLGGTGIIGRVIQRRTGRPLSQSYLYTDGLVIFAAGVIFGWELALYALITLFVNGLASDYTLEGPSRTRTATIITNKPETLVPALMQSLQHGVSYWEVIGGYSGARRHMLMCTVARSQVTDLKQVVAAADPEAFVTIGLSHEALGAGFSPLRES